MPKHTYTPEVIQELMELASFYGANLNTYEAFLEDVAHNPPLDATEAWNAAAYEYNANIAARNEQGVFDAYQKLETIHSEWPNHFDKNRTFLDEARTHIVNIQKIIELKER